MELRPKCQAGRLFPGLAAGGHGNVVVSVADLVFKRGLTSRADAKSQDVLSPGAAAALVVESGS